MSKNEDDLTDGASGLVLAIVLTGIIGAGSALAAPPVCGDGVCRGKESFASCPADCPVGDDPSTPPFVQTHEAAVGHSLGALACDSASHADGNIFDVGTTDAFGEAVCGLLQCAVYGGGTVACGHNSDFNDEPRPRVDVNGADTYDPSDRTGLFDLWDQDDRSQGDPAVCFGTNGIIDPIVQVGTTSEGEFDVRLFFRAEVDTTLPGRCKGASDLIRYGAQFGPCFLDPSHSFPPGAGLTAAVTCGAGAQASVRREGGGGAASKCGCHAEGALAQDTLIVIRGIN